MKIHVLNLIISCLIFPSFSLCQSSWSAIETFEIGQTEYWIERRDCADCEYPSLIKITEVSDKGLETRNAIIKSGLRSVDSWATFGEKLILLGEVNSNVKMVTVLDTSKFEAIESFFAFEPMLSPSGRYVAFRKFYPRFGAVELKTELYLIYDVQRENLSQRLENVSSDRVEVAGIPIFPIRNFREKTYDVFVESEAFRDNSLAMKWHDKIDLLLILNRRNVVLSVVTVDLENSEEIVPRFINLTFEDYRTDEWTEELTQKISRSFYPQKIYFDEGKSIVIEPVQREYFPEALKFRVKQSALVPYTESNG